MLNKIQILNLKFWFYMIYFLFVAFYYAIFIYSVLAFPFFTLFIKKSCIAEERKL